MQTRAKKGKRMMLEGPPLLPTDKGFLPGVLHARDEYKKKRNGSLCPYILCPTRFT
jgi:hypothetical protein